MRTRWLAVTLVAAMAAGGTVGADDETVPESEPERPLGAWIDDLGSDDAATVREAVVAIGRLGDPALPALVEALERSGSARVRVFVARWFGDMGERGAIAVPALVRALGRPGDEGDEVTSALAKIGAPAAAALVEALGAADEKTRERADRALTDMDGAASRPALAAAIRDRKRAATVRATAVRAYRLALDLPSWTSPETATLAACVVEAAADPAPQVRIEAIRALRSWHRGVPGSPRALAVALGHADAATRREAADAIGVVVGRSKECGGWSEEPGPDEALPDEPGAIEAAIQALRDGDPRVRAAAAEAVGRVGRRAAPAQSELCLRLSMDPAAGVRAAAAFALGEIGADPAAAVPVLAALLGDREVSVRRQAAGGLSGFGAAAAPAIPALIAVLKEDGPTLPEGALLVDPDGDGLIAFDERPAGELAAEALARIGRAALPALEEAARDPRPDVRARAQAGFTMLRRIEDARAAGRQ